MVQKLRRNFCQRQLNVTESLRKFRTNFCFKFVIQETKIRNSVPYHFGICLGNKLIPASSYFGSFSVFSKFSIGNCPKSFQILVFNPLRFTTSRIRISRICFPHYFNFIKSVQYRKSVFFFLTESHDFFIAKNPENLHQQR